MFVKVIRAFFAIAAAAGVAASITGYFASLAGVILRDLPWLIILSTGAILVQIPIGVLEYSSLNSVIFSWKAFVLLDGIPWLQTRLRVCVRTLRLFWFLTMANFIWFGIRASGGVPEIKDDIYILNSHGKILKILTESEFLALKSEYLRCFLALMVFCYMVAVIYWWFPCNHIQQSE
jgi:hypothetical protein